MQESIWEGLAPPTPAPSQELELSGASSSCSIRADASREGSSAGLVGLDAPAETYMVRGHERTQTIACGLTSLACGRPH